MDITFQKLFFSSGSNSEEKKKATSEQEDAASEKKDLAKEKVKSDVPVKTKAEVDSRLKSESISTPESKAVQKTELESTRNAEPEMTEPEMVVEIKATSVLVSKSKLEAAAVAKDESATNAVSQKKPKPEGDVLSAETLKKKEISAGVSNTLASSLTSKDLDSQVVSEPNQNKTLGEMSMLSTRPESKNEESTTVYPSAVDSKNTQRPAAPVESSEKELPTAIIGPKIRFKGELVGEEDLLIQGRVEGTIDLKGQNLTVGDCGELQANVTAKTVIVEGRVEGDVYGEERIAITASSNVRGNIKAERVVLEDGAKFRGSIDMDMDDDEPAAKPASGAAASATKEPAAKTAAKETETKGRANSNAKKPEEA